MNSFYDALEARTPENRESELMSALQIQLAHVKANTIYGQLFSEYNPADFVGRVDLASLPVTRKTDLKGLQDKKKPFGGLVPKTSEAIKYIFSSPGPIYELATDRPDFFRSARALFAAGFRKGDIIHNCFSYHLTPAGAMFDTGAHALGCPVIPAGVGQTELQVTTIADVKPAGYVGTPSFLKLILEKADEMQADISCLKKALVSGEALPPSLRQVFRDRGIDVYQCYGTADLGIVAYESNALEGMIIDEGIILELVNPGTGEPVEAGEVGEIVVTTLNPDYPLIRYATGDLSAILPGGSPCGRTADRIKGWMGRADQSAKVRGMFIHPHQISAIVQKVESVSAARMIIDSRDHTDHMELHVETADTGPDLISAISTAIRDVCKVRGEVVLVTPGALPKDGIQIEDRRTYE